MRRSVLVGLVALISAGCDAMQLGSGALRPEMAGTALETPLQRPDFVLPRTDGSRFDFKAETEGDVTLLFFGYTNCPDICPVHLANLAAVLRDLPFEMSRHVSAIFITADPDRDTPERMEEWIDQMGWPFIGLRGTRAEVNAIEAALEIPQSTVQIQEDGSIFVAHAAQVIAFGGDGPARWVYPWGVRQQDWLQDLPKLISGTVPGFETGG